MQDAKYVLIIRNYVFPPPEFLLCSSLLTNMPSRFSSKLLLFSQFFIFLFQEKSIQPIASKSTPFDHNTSQTKQCSFGTNSTSIITTLQTDR